MTSRNSPETWLKKSYILVARPKKVAQATQNLKTTLSLPDSLYDPSYHVDPCWVHDITLRIFLLRKNVWPKAYVSIRFSSSTDLPLIVKRVYVSNWKKSWLTLPEMAEFYSRSWKSGQCGHTERSAYKQAAACGHLKIWVARMRPHAGKNLKFCPHFGALACNLLPTSV